MSGRVPSSVALAGALLVAAGCSAPAREATSPPPLPPGEFRPTADQWSNLSIVPVRTTVYGPAIITDGQIATDDDRTTQLFSPFTGRISRIFVKPGDPVRRGQPIYAIAAAELVQGRSDLATAQASLAAAQKALAVAEANAVRQQALLAVQGAAARDAQQAQADLATARGNAATSEAQLAAARGRLAILGLARGGGATGRGDEAVVRSPIDGTVITRQAGIGQYVESAQAGAATPLFTISDLSHVWLVANVREADAARLARGVTLAVQVPAFPDRTFAGRVYYVAPIVDPTTRRIVVRAQIANPGGALRPNMFATARLADGPAIAAVTVPAEAVLFEGDRAHVWVAHPERRSLSLRAIGAGTSTGSAVTVTRGLHPGERVVAAGSVFIDRANGAS